MPISGNVALTDTFDTWRGKTNETILAYNKLESGQITIVSNTSNTLQINGSNTSQTSPVGTVYFSVNALSTSGGTVTGTINLNSITANTNGLYLGGMRILSNGHIIMI